MAKLDDKYKVFRPKGYNPDYIFIVDYFGCLNPRTYGKEYLIEEFKEFMKQVKRKLWITKINTMN